VSLYLLLGDFGSHWELVRIYLVLWDGAACQFSLFVTASIVTSTVSGSGSFIRVGMHVFPLYSCKELCSAGNDCVFR
jgi:hypothetical protein